MDELICMYRFYKKEIIDKLKKMKKVLKLKDVSISFIFPGKCKIMLEGIGSMKTECVINDTYIKFYDNFYIEQDGLCLGKNSFKPEIKKVYDDKYSLRKKERKIQVYKYQIKLKLSYKEFVLSLKKVKKTFVYMYVYNTKIELNIGKDDLRLIIDNINLSIFESPNE